MKPWSVFVATLIFVLVGALVLGLWQAREALLLAFGAAIVATLLLAITKPIERRTGMRRTWSLALSGVLLLAIAGGFSWALGSQLGAQVAELQRRLPDSMDAAERRLREALGLSPQAANQQNGQSNQQGSASASANASSTGRSSADSSGPGGSGSSSDSANAATQSGLPSGLDLKQILTGAIGSIASFGTMLVSSLASLVIVVVGGFYLASDPSKYRQGIVELFPRSKQQVADDAVKSAGQSLHQWLLAQLISMALIGTMVGLGAWLIGLPAALALGLFAGLTEFIPVIGSYLGAAPALVIAASSGTDTLLWTIGLFLAVQQIESNVITPLVQQRMTDIPAFLLLFAIIGLGLIFGFVGVIIAAPLAVVLHTLVKKLYIEEALGNDPGGEKGT